MGRRGAIAADGRCRNPAASMAGGTVARHRRRDLRCGGAQPQQSHARAAVGVAGHAAGVHPHVRRDRRAALERPPDARGHGPLGADGARAGRGAVALAAGYHGRRTFATGGGHGFAGNLFPALRGAHMLPADLVAGYAQRTEETLRATASGRGLANWPDRLPLPGENPIGAGAGLPRRPGIVCRLPARVQYAELATCCCRPAS